MTMVLEMFCARPGHVYVNVPKLKAERLLQLPHLNPSGIPVYTQLPNIKGNVSHLSHSVTLSVLLYQVSEYQKYSVDMWPIEEPLNRLISRLVDTGMMAEFQRRSSRQILGVNYSMETRQPRLYYAPVGMDELYFIFIIELVGMTLGFLIFIAEVLMSVDWRYQV